MSKSGIRWGQGLVFLRRVSKGPVHLQTQTRNEQMEFAGQVGAEL